MSSSRCFRSLLEKLVFDVIVAHERELAEVRSEQFQPQNEHAAESLNCNGGFTPRGSVTPREKESSKAMATLSSIPEQVRPKANTLLQTPRHQSMCRSSQQPSQPMRQSSSWDLEALLNDEMCAVEDAVQDAQYSNFVIHEQYTQSCALGSHGSEVQLREAAPGKRSTLQGLVIANLPADYLDHLRTQFEHLEPDELNRISLDQCLATISEFTDIALERENLVEVLTRVHRERIEFERLSGMQHPETNESPAQWDGEWITFEDFTYLMACGEFAPEGQESMDSITPEDNCYYRTMQDAVRACEEYHKSLAAKAELRSLKYKRLVMLLDCAPVPVIILNALVMGLRADIDPGADFWKIFDLLFLAFYISEAAVKLRVFKCKIYFFGPGWGWNWFDIFCIAVSLCDLCIVFVLPLITEDKNSFKLKEVMLVKTLRLGRLARLVKALRYPVFNELKAMVYGVVAGVRVIIWAIVLLFVCVFFLGVLMNNLIGSEREEFDTAPASMFTIFRCVTDGCSAYDGTPLQEHLRKAYGATFIVPYTIAFMFITVGVFNLIMATFIDNVVSSTQARKQEELGHSFDAARLSLQRTFIGLVTHDASGKKGRRLISGHLSKDVEKMARHDPESAFKMLPRDLAISKRVFGRWLADEEFIAVLEDTNVDTSNTCSLFDVLDADMSGELTLTELIDGLMRLRGPITKCDMIGVRMQLRYVMQVVQAIVGTLNLKNATPSISDIKSLRYSLLTSSA